MAEYLAKSEDLTAVADAIRAKGGTDAQLTFPDGFAAAVQAIPTGTSITDGIVVKERNTDGYATEVDFYGSEIKQSQFGANSHTITGLSYVKQVNFMSPVTKVGARAFAVNLSVGKAAPIPPEITEVGDLAYASSGYVSCDFPVAVTHLPDNLVSNCKALKTFTAPGAESLRTHGGNGNGQFLNCVALETCNLGSVGHAVTYIPTWSFRGCTQAELTITVYTNGDYVDTAVSNIRNGATNATIIIKAVADTTYNDVAYAAGDTILASTPEAST